MDNGFKKTQTLIESLWQLWYLRTHWSMFPPPFLLLHYGHLENYHWQWPHSCHQGTVQSNRGRCSLCFQFLTDMDPDSFHILLQEKGLNPMKHWYIQKMGVFVFECNAPICMKHLKFRGTVSKLQLYKGWGP